MKVAQEIARGNQWYVGDETAGQLATPGGHAVTEIRWWRFGELVRS